MIVMLTVGVMVMMAVRMIVKVIAIMAVMLLPQPNHGCSLGPVCVFYVGDYKQLCLFVCLFVGGARREIGHKRAKPTAP